MPSTHSLPGLALTDHEFEIPLDYSYPERETSTSTMVCAPMARSFSGA